MQKLFLSTVFAAVVILSSFGCKKQNSTSSGTGSGAPSSNEVFMQNVAFNPASIAVSVNTTVKWTNKDAVAHTVTTGSFDSGNIPAGGTYNHQFTAAGTYSYRCTFHSNMTGVVIVQ